jgi:hypothetical protein
VQDAANNFLVNGTTSAYGVSNLLTVWRKMHTEVDSMGLVINNEISGSVTSVGNQTNRRIDTNVTKTLLNNDSAERFENGRLTIGSDIYEVVSSNYDSSDMLYLIIKRNEDSGGVELSVPAAGNTFTLVDDDHLPNGQDVPTPNMSHVATAFQPAYILPVYNGGSNPSNDQSTVSFAGNVAELSADVTDQIGQGRNSPVSQDDFWIIYVQGAFQYAFRNDNDSNSEPEGMGITASLDNTVSVNEGSLIFLETIHDYDNSNPSRVQPEEWIVAHEIGHLFVLDLDSNGDEHEIDGSLMSAGGQVTNPAFNNLNLDQIRSTIAP